MHTQIDQMRHNDRTNARNEYRHEAQWRSNEIPRDKHQKERRTHTNEL